MYDVLSNIVVGRVYGINHPTELCARLIGIIRRDLNIPYTDCVIQPNNFDGKEVAQPTKGACCSGVVGIKIMQYQYSAQPMTCSLVHTYIGSQGKCTVTV